MIHPRNCDKDSVHKRSWCIIYKEQQHLLFLSSDEFTKFQRENNDATEGYTVWADVLKEVNMLLSNPRPESCVEEKISGIEHMMAALLGIMKWKQVKKDL